LYNVKDIDQNLFFCSRTPGFANTICQMGCYFHSIYFCSNCQKLSRHSFFVGLFLGSLFHSIRFLASVYVDTSLCLLLLLYSIEYKSWNIVLALFRIVLDIHSHCNSIWMLILVFPNRWNMTLKFCPEFLLLHPSNKLVCSLLFIGVFTQFLYQDNINFIEWIWQWTFTFYIMEQGKRKGMRLLEICWVLWLSLMGRFWLGSHGL